MILSFLPFRTSTKYKRDMQGISLKITKRSLKTILNSVLLPERFVNLRTCPFGPRKTGRLQITIPEQSSSFKSPESFTSSAEHGAHFPAQIYWRCSILIHKCFNILKHHTLIMCKMQSFFIVHRSDILRSSFGSHYQCGS